MSGIVENFLFQSGLEFKKRLCRLDHETYRGLNHQNKMNQNMNIKRNLLGRILSPFKIVQMNPVEPVWKLGEIFKRGAPIMGKNKNKKVILGCLIIICLSQSAPP